MRGLICLALVGAMGVASATANPFAVDTAKLERAAQERAQAQAAWMGKAIQTRTLYVKEITVDTYDLGLELRSRQFQGTQSFLREQGDSLREITRQTGWEVCARVCLSADGYKGLRVQTLGAALACHAGNQESDCPDGMIPTPIVVHTHGEGSIVQATAVDIHLGHEGEVAWIQDGNMPSPEDLHSGPGWLLAPDGSVVGYGQHPEWMSP